MRRGCSSAKFAEAQAKSGAKNFKNSGFQNQHRPFTHDDIKVDRAHSTLNLLDESDGEGEGAGADGESKKKVKKPKSVAKPKSATKNIGGGSGSKPFPVKPPRAQRKLSEDLRDFLQKCLCMQPGKRHTALQLQSHPFVINNLFDKPMRDPVNCPDPASLVQDYLKKFRSLKERGEREAREQAQAAASAAAAAEQAKAMQAASPASPAGKKHRVDVYGAGAGSP